MAESLEIVEHYTGHRGAVYCLVGRPGGGGFVSCGGDGWVAEWVLGRADGRLLAELGGAGVSAAWLDGGAVLAVGTLEGRLHFIRPGKADATKVYDLGGKASVFALYFDGKHLWSGDGLGRLCQWSADGQLLDSRSITAGHAIRCIIGRGENHLLIACSDSCIYFHEKSSGESGPQWQAHTPSVFTLALHNDSGSLWSGGRDALIRQWNLEPESPVEEACIQAHWFTVNDIKFHPGQRIFASASRDKRIRMWSAEGALLQSIDPMTHGGHINSVNSLLWSEDGAFLLSAGDDRSIRQWAVKS